MFCGLVALQHQTPVTKELLLRSRYAVWAEHCALCSWLLNTGVSAFTLRMA